MFLGYSANGGGTFLECRVYGTHGCLTSIESCSESNMTCSEGEFCFASWTNKSTGPVVHKGCWIADVENCNMPHCELTLKKESTAKLDDYYFCCCNGNFCNLNLTRARRPRGDTNETLTTEKCELDCCLV